MKKNNCKAKILRTISKSFMIVSSITTPVFICFYIVSLNSAVFTNTWFAQALPEIIGIQVFIFLLGLFLYFLYFPKEKPKKKRIIASSLIMSGYILELFGIMLLLYSDTNGFKKWLIEKSMNTFNYQYLATFLYTDSDIRKVLLEKQVVHEEYEEIITFDDIKYNQKNYANKYEEEILTKDSIDQIYKIINIKGKTRYENYNYQGYLAVIYDPSKVSIATSLGAGTDDKAYGETIEVMAKRSNALVAINAGGWYDPEWKSNGGIPHGTVISKGEFKTYFRPVPYNGGIIGFDINNRLVLKNMSTEEALEIGIRDCVDFGPFLIVNGKSNYATSAGGWGIQPRTAIGQRKDGIVLMLVIDGRQEHSLGVDLNDLADILLKYGAYNAANLDGGTSSTMYENGKIINVPHNGARRTIRSMPNAFIVTK